METDEKTLQRLSTLALTLRYKRDAEVMKEEDENLYHALLDSSVRVQVIADKNACEDSLYAICSSLQGTHEKFTDVRTLLGKQFYQARRLTSEERLLSVLFDGIYVGHPEDLLQIRNGHDEEVLYPVKGLGEKMADIIFLE